MSHLFRSELKSKELLSREHRNYLSNVLILNKSKSFSREKEYNPSKKNNSLPAEILEIEEEIITREDKEQENKKEKIKMKWICNNWMVQVFIFTTLQNLDKTDEDQQGKWGRIWKCQTDKHNRGRRARNIITIISRKHQKQDKMKGNVGAVNWWVKKGKKIKTVENKQTKTTKTELEE